MDSRQDAQTLTLPQLRASGRAGWKEGYLFVEETVFRIVAIPKTDRVYQVAVRPSALEETSTKLHDGWAFMPHDGRRLTPIPQPAD